MSDQFKQHLQALEAAHHQALSEQAIAHAAELASDSTQQQAKAWNAVHAALSRARPGWYSRRDMKTIEAAVATINEMADRIAELELQLVFKINHLDYPEPEKAAGLPAVGFMQPLSDDEMALAAKPHGDDDPFAVDWPRAPTNANWHAVDMDGKGWWYAGKPILRSYAFSVGDDVRVPAFMSKAFTVTGQQWKDSLRQRPRLGTDSEGGGHD